MSEPSNAKTHWTRGEKDRVTRLSKSQVDDEYLSDYASENDQSALQSSAKKRKFDETDVDAADEDLKTRSKMVRSPSSSIMRTYFFKSWKLILLKVKPFGIATDVEEYDFHASHGTKRAFTPESVSIHTDYTTDGEDEWSTDLEYIEEVKYDDGDQGKEEGEADGEEDGGEEAEGVVEEEKEESAGSTTPTYTPKSSATISRVNASATATGSSGASAAAMAIKAGAGDPPRHPQRQGNFLSLLKAPKPPMDCPVDIDPSLSWRRTLQPQLTRAQPYVALQQATMEPVPPLHTNLGTFHSRVLHPTSQETHPSLVGLTTSITGRPSIGAPKESHQPPGSHFKTASRGPAPRRFSLQSRRFTKASHSSLPARQRRKRTPWKRPHQPKSTESRP